MRLKDCTPKNGASKAETYSIFVVQKNSSQIVRQSHAWTLKNTIIFNVCLVKKDWKGIGVWESST